MLYGAFLGDLIAWAQHRSPCPFCVALSPSINRSSKRGGSPLVTFRRARGGGIISCGDSFAGENFGGGECRRPCESQSLHCLTHTLHFYGNCKGCAIHVAYMAGHLDCLEPSLGSWSGTRDPLQLLCASCPLSLSPTGPSTGTLTMWGFRVV